MRHTATALLIALATAALPGCGQMGPLYMPPPESSEQSEPKPAPAEQPSNAKKS